MLNDQDDKYNNPEEEGEYHFSDEDVSYEVDTQEAAKPTTSSSANKWNALFANLTRSRRMIISLLVFLALVFVVYKMLAPTDSSPGSEITAAPITSGAEGAIPNTMPGQQNIPVNNVSTNNMPVVNNPPAIPAPQPIAMQQTLQAAPLEAQQGLQPPAQTPMQAMPQTSPMPAPAQQMPTQTAPSMPAVMPVESTPSNAYAMPSTMNTVNTAPAQAVQAQISQAQAEYAQKLNDYVNQNKALLDQVQALNSRVAMMETQMGQMVQALTHRDAQQTAEAPVEASAPTVDNGRSGYTVQAIIPGRAWLKADNGETVTVAEGDVIKDLGRVSKIDPYDGVVEINTGNKVISLSYGSGS